VGLCKKKRFGRATIDPESHGSLRRRATGKENCEANFARTCWLCAKMLWTEISSRNVSAIMRRTPLTRSKLNITTKTTNREFPWHQYPMFDRCSGPSVRMSKFVSAWDQRYLLPVAFADAGSCARVSPSRAGFTHGPAQNKRGHRIVSHRYSGALQH